MEVLLRKWMIKACNVVSNHPHFVITLSVMFRELERERDDVSYSPQVMSPIADHCQGP